MPNTRMVLSPADIYRIHNKRKKTYKNIWQILSDLQMLEEKWNVDWPFYLKKIRDKYNIDERTIKKYLKWFVYKIWRNSLILLDDSDLLVIKETITAMRRFENLSKNHQKLAKYITYNMISWQTQN